MGTIDAILFDMDGVLMDSEPLHLRATQFALGERAGYTERDNQSFFGVTDTELFRILRILFNLDASTDDLVRKKHECLVALVRAEGRRLPGVPEIPLRFREAGFRLGLVSASARPIIDTILETVGLGRAFETIVSGDEVARGKPAPDGYLMAARRLEVGPERCFVVEDTRNGVLAAKAAGMTVAAVPSSASSHEDFSPADLVLPSLEALPKVLDRNGNGNGNANAKWERTPSLVGGRPAGTGARRMSLGEPNVKRALEWIIAQLADDPGAKRGKLIDQAAREFDLTPLEEDFLQRQLVDALKKKGPGPATS